MIKYDLKELEDIPNYLNNLTLPLTKTPNLSLSKLCRLKDRVLKRVLQKERFVKSLFSLVSLTIIIMKTQHEITRINMDYTAMVLKSVTICQSVLIRVMFFEIPMAFHSLPIFFIIEIYLLYKHIFMSFLKFLSFFF